MRDWIPSLTRLDLRVGPVRREHWVERERDQQRHKDSCGDRESERLEPLSCHSIHESDGNEHGHDRERRRGNSKSDLVGAFVRRRHVIFAHLDVAHDVLAHHDRVIDQNSDRQRETEQRHRVERKSECPHRDKGRKYRYRQRKSGNDCRSPRIQEYEHD